GDTAGLIVLLTEDARLTMPPLPLEYVGHVAIAEFLDARAEVRGGVPLQVRPTRANGHPAFGCYLHGEGCGMLGLTLRGEQVAEMTFFFDRSLVDWFGLSRAI